MQGKLLSPLEAGSVYRNEKLRTLISEAESLDDGLTPAIRALLSRIAGLTAEIEELKAKQEVNTSQVSLSVF